MPKFRLEFILDAYNTKLATIKNSLLEFGDGLEVTLVEEACVAKTNNFKININTEDPTVIFDICGQFGRIKSVKVEES